MVEWSLRNEIYSALHRWPLIMLYGLAGCLLGLILSLVLPTPWRVTAEIYVGFEPYRWSEDENVVAYALGTRFNYADDYKNWQMANLNALVSMDDVRLKTLERLRESDSYWSDVNRRQLGEMLQVYWRNPGRWRLVAEHTDPKLAQAAASAWQEIVYEIVQASVVYAQDTFRLDIQLKAIQKEQLELSTRQAELETILAGLNSIKMTLAELPDSQALDELTRWQVWSWAAHSAPYNPVWAALLEGLPTADAQPGAYLTWLDKVQLTVEQEIQTTQARQDTLTAQKEQSVAAYALASQASRGLSANLQLEKFSDNPAPQAVRPVARLSLIGTFFGIFAWLALWTARLTLRKPV